MSNNTKKPLWKKNFKKTLDDCMYGYYGPYMEKVHNEEFSKVEDKAITYDQFLKNMELKLESYFKQNPDMAPKPSFNKRTLVEKYQRGTARNHVGDYIPVYNASDIEEVRKLIKNKQDALSDAKSKETKFLLPAAATFGTIPVAALASKIPNKKIANSLTAGIILSSLPLATASIVSMAKGENRTKKAQQDLDKEKDAIKLLQIADRKIGVRGYDYKINKKAEAHEYIIEKTAGLKDIGKKIKKIPGRYGDLLVGNSAREARIARDDVVDMLNALKDERDTLGKSRMSLKGELQTAGENIGTYKASLEKTKKDLHKSKKSKQEKIRLINQSKADLDNAYKVHKTKKDALNDIENRINAKLGEIDKANSSLEAKRDKYTSENGKHLLTVGGTVGGIGIGTYKSIDSVSNRRKER